PLCAPPALTLHLRRRWQRSLRTLCAPPALNLRRPWPALRPHRPGASSRLASCAVASIPSPRTPPSVHVLMLPAASRAAFLRCGACIRRSAPSFYLFPCHASCPAKTPKCSVHVLVHRPRPCPAALPCNRRAGCHLLMHRPRPCPA